MKIVHISDLHFGLHEEQVLTDFLNDLSTVQPDVILISGDVTHRAKHEQYQALTAFLKKLNGQTLIVPGNHDIPLFDIYSRLVSPFKRFDQYVSDNQSDTYENEDLRIFGANSVNRYRVKKGRLSNTTLGNIDQFFKDPFKGLGILFFHHNIDRFEGTHKPLENYRQLLAYLKESTIDIVCTGHLHYANINVIEKADLKPCLLLHAGSLSCQRKKDAHHSYFLIERNVKDCVIDLRVYNNGAFEVRQRYEIDFTKPFSTALQNLHQLNGK